MLILACKICEKESVVDEVFYKKMFICYGCEGSEPHEMILLQNRLRAEMFKAIDDGWKTKFAKEFQRII